MSVCQDDIFSKYQRIFTKLVLCIDTVETWVVMLMGKFHQLFTELSPHYTSVFPFSDDNLSKYQWIFIKLGMCIDIVVISFGIADGQILSIF